MKAWTLRSVAALAAAFGLFGLALGADEAAPPPAPAAGAELLDGYAQTKGGEGGKVVEVTTLDDDGPGSFRAALAEAAKGPTMITFKVGGTIYAKTTLRLAGANITIDGSTAPAPGITISGAKLGDVNGPPLEWKALLMTGQLKQVIIRHIRLRDTNVYNMHVGSASNLILDHVSSTHCGDGALFINPSSNVTLRYCLFGFNGLCMRVRADRLSIHHCLYTNNNQRQPFIRETPGIVDFRNNVVQKWSGYIISCYTPNRVNVINNFFDIAENGRPPTDAFWLRGGPPTGAGDNDPKIGETKASEHHLHAEGNAGPTAAALPSLSVGAAPYEPQPKVATQSAEEARKLVLEQAGALPRDEIDKALAEGRGVGHVIGKNTRPRDNISEKIGVKGTLPAAVPVADTGKGGD